MDFGISLLPDAGPDTKSPTAYFDDVLALARIADEAGMSHVKMTEHYLHPYGGYCPSPLGFLAAVAAQTTNIRLMTGCVLPAFHHPVKLASYAAMVDAISHGRLDIGFARAYLPYEFETFGVDMDSSRERFEATIKAVLRLWTEENVTEDTPFFSYRDATILPRPTQTPHPPVWAAAVRSAESFTRIGELGLGLLITPSLTPLEAVREQVALYRDAFERTHGESGQQPRVAASLPVFTAETDAEAQRLGDPLLAEYLRVWGGATSSWNSATSKAYPGYDQVGKYVGMITPERLRTEGGAVVGSAATVAEKLAAFQDVVQADHILLQADFGAMPGDVAERSLQLFLEDVRPKFPAA
ncbi:LLM class flavin-dependent oxidoreductase [Kitasatospora sp. NBC_00085]|uniref:LLM class flavin-dependent oxidoreductase n=1 Tax=unclassified Kitasatospora TaxID=2633591 RepID=UPI00324E3E05